jgi:hypothetical protein
VRAELREKVVTKFWAKLERLSDYLLPGKPKEKQIWRRVYHTQHGKKVMKGFEASLRRMPDEQFEAVMAQLDSMDPIEIMRQASTSVLGHLPKKRGGRPGIYKLEIRQRAIQDIGHEYPRCNSLGEAIDLVAVRYGMTSEYLHKVWKNRRRLRLREDKPKE